MLAPAARAALVLARRAVVGAAGVAAGAADAAAAAPAAARPARRMADELAQRLVVLARLGALAQGAAVDRAERAAAVAVGHGDLGLEEAVDLEHDAVQRRVAVGDGHE